MSDHEGPPPIATVKSPFDDVNADVILRTSDHVDFRVYRVILALSSSFFRGTFPPPSNDGSATCSVDVPEDSVTLDTLLRFIYPNTEIPSLGGVLDAFKVATAASKYDMPTTLAKIAAYVQENYAKSLPLHTYFVACRMGWEAVARAAAKGCIDLEFMDCMIPDLTESGLLDYQGSGIAYHNLDLYRYNYRQAAEQKLANMEIVRDVYTCNTSCNSMDSKSDGISQHCLRRWVVRYLENIREMVLKDPGSNDIDICPSSDCIECDLTLADTIALARLEISSLVNEVLQQTELRFGS